MEFKKENVNPKGIKTGDCVVRALSRANNVSWEVAYLELSDIGLRKFRMPNDKPTYEEYLKNTGWTKYKMPKKESGKKYTIEEFIDSLPPYHRSKGIVISIARHLTYVENGVLIDTWNCGRKYVCNYWIKF